MARLVSIRREVAFWSSRCSEKENDHAVDRELADALDEALNTLDDEDELSVGVLTGTSTVFSAGSDPTSGGDYVTERGGEYGIIRRQRRKPLIAAVGGRALGGGLEIVLSCDLVVASTSARFGLSEVRIGLIPTCGALFRSPNALPLNLARELILTGEPIDAFGRTLPDSSTRSPSRAALWNGRWSSRARFAQARRSRCRHAWPP
jgi:enoyl-CoA hydratase/carnithine racemase